ncbi:PREDICTED: tripartite motif-containing protein 2-like [Branchiostoma belcheri]|uniref:Tripartite motif-containing protein 2-like n=1 Tax=Branchiostoma belcheri TaxID=7741 RepID=A0A6P4YUY8_BRABE|nr:PREDICTED: tripartite motif-containing protein 2-like [Branchiostoma belcheri]
MAAAKKSLSLGQQILREELSCSICLELFTRPKVLPCQHTFCQDCLQVYFEQSQKPFKCPSCHLEVRLPPEGVTGLPENHSVAKLCEKLQKTAAKPAKTAPKCSSHPSEAPKLYCTQCDVPICYICLEQTHANHSTTTIQKASKERKPEAEKLLAEGKEILGNYYTTLRDLREQEKRLLEQKKERERRIIEAYERTMKEFEQTANRLRQRMQEKHDENTEERERQMERLEHDFRELTAACDQAELDMAQPVGIFLQREDRLTEVIEKHRRALPLPQLRTQVIDFHPRDPDKMPAPLLGQVVVVDTTVDGSKGKGDHHGNQGQGQEQADTR